MSRGAFFLALLLVIMGLTFLIAAMRGRSVQMLAALQQLGTVSSSSGSKSGQTKTR